MDVFDRLRVPPVSHSREAFLQEHNPLEGDTPPRKSVEDWLDVGFFVDRKNSICKLEGRDSDVGVYPAASQKPFVARGEDFWLPVSRQLLMNIAQKGIHFMKRRKQNWVEGSLGVVSRWGAVAIVAAFVCLGQVTKARAADTAMGGQKWYESVRLRVDGNLAGRVVKFTPSGEVVPAQAKVFFVQNGQVVGNVQTGENGAFQAMKLSPGVYSVMAAGADGIAVLAVRVLPYASPEVKRQASGASESSGGLRARTVALAETPADENTLEIPLIPRSDLDALQAVLGEQVPGMAGVAPGAATTPGAAGPGGAGAAGGGLGALAGLAGLAGTAGGGVPASPKAP